MSCQTGPLLSHENLIQHCAEAVSTIQSDCAAVLLFTTANNRPLTQHPLAGCHGALVDLLGRQASVIHAFYEQQTRSRLTHCDGAIYHLALRRVDDVASVAYSKFYAFLFEDLPHCWRQLYTDARILKFCLLLLRRSTCPPRPGSTIDDELVKALDLALILAGGAGERRGRTWIDTAFNLLALALCDGNRESRNVAGGEARAAKRARVADCYNNGPAAPTFSSTESFTPPVSHAVLSVDAPSIDDFQVYMDRPRNPALGPEPLMIRGALADWPALSSRPWNHPPYLLSKTLDGRRLVPVEVGRSYVDEGWGQKLIPFGEFLRDYIDTRLRPGQDRSGKGDTVGQADADSSAAQRQSSSETTPSTTTLSDPDPSTRFIRDGGAPDPQKPTAYLAQHQLFTQLPSLRDDIRIPDYCYTAPPPPSPYSDNPVPELSEPLLNAWFGPAGTISPLHHDPYHNVLAQVVGRKYVRLYAPRETRRLAARGWEHGVEMGNTSLWDVGVMEGWDHQHSKKAEANHDEGDDVKGDAFADIPFVDCILGPGDALYIPVGWWHYVRGLSVSFSVSFWWN